MVSLSQGALLM